MKLLVLPLLIISFYSYTKQIVFEEKEKNKCANINDNILSNLRTHGSIPNLYKNYYGYNAQNCRLSDSNYECCCYMSVGHSKLNEKGKEEVKWYNFCGKINKEKFKKKEYKDFVNDFIKDVVYESNKNVFNKKGKRDEYYLKIDCFSSKMNFVKSFIFALLFLLF